MKCKNKDQMNVVQLERPKIKRYEHLRGVKEDNDLVGVSSTDRDMLKVQGEW
jgi:hypothetical protein